MTPPGLGLGDPAFVGRVGAPSVDITTGLVAWLKLDDASGTNAADSSGNGNNGTLGGGTAWTSGHVNGAASFDGTNDDITFAGSGLTTGTTFTFCAWVKPNSQPANYGTLLGKADGTVGIYHLGTSTGGSIGKLDFYYSGGSHFSTAALTDAAWNHIMVVVDAGSVTQYLNNSANGTSSSATSFAAKHIGGDPFSQAFKGDLDDIRLYNIALSAEQRAAVYAYAG